MSNDIRRWMRLVEGEIPPSTDTKKYFHGSKKLFKVGFVLKPQETGYAYGTGEPPLEKRVRRWCEHYLEINRPVVPRLRQESFNSNPMDGNSRWANFCMGIRRKKIPKSHG